MTGFKLQRTETGISVLFLCTPQCFNLAPFVGGSPVPTSFGHQKRLWGELRLSLSVIFLLLGIPSPFTTNIQLLCALKLQAQKALTLYCLHSTWLRNALGLKKQQAHESSSLRMYSFLVFTYFLTAPPGLSPHIYRLTAARGLGEFALRI